MSVLLAFPGNEALAGLLADSLGSQCLPVALHGFPDGETRLRLPALSSTDNVALVCSLDRPDAKYLPLIFAAATARQKGARRVGLIAPYLGYMRQDIAFHEGEAITARLFAAELSGSFDWIATVDPHLHRIPKLDAIFTIPAIAVHAAPAIADWISTNVERPVVVGPDSESAQWVSEIAKNCRAPYATFRKTRRGDSDVVVSGELPAGGTAVIVDDIISTAHTMAEAVRATRRQFGSAPWCIGIHAIFASDADEILNRAGIRGVLTTNTVQHATNRIDISAPLAEAMKTILARFT